jgi:hypothetical protein
VSRPERVLRALLVCIALLIVAHFASDALYHTVSRGLIATRLRKLFLFDGEGNLPAYFSALVILGAGLAVGVAGQVEAQRKGPWKTHLFVLAFALVFLSIDEAAQIHEVIDSATSYILLRTGLLEPNSSLAWPWVIPYVSVALAGALLYIPFLRALPRSVAVILCMAGAIFVCGAAGLDMLEGLLTRRTDAGAQASAMFVVQAIEETMEMLGMSLLLFGALRYLQHQKARLAIQLAPAT